MSGAWGVFDGRSYHAECFEKFAGPRCAICFDVVFANPEKGLSGRWLTVRDRKEIAHLECYVKLANSRGQHPAVIPGYAPTSAAAAAARLADNTAAAANPTPPWIDPKREKALQAAGIEPPKIGGEFAAPAYPPDDKSSSAPPPPYLP